MNWCFNITKSQSSGMGYFSIRGEARSPEGVTHKFLVSGRVDDSKIQLGVHQDGWSRKEGVDENLELDQKSKRVISKKCRELVRDGTIVV